MFAPAGAKGYGTNACHSDDINTSAYLLRPIRGEITNVHFPRVPAACGGLHPWLQPIAPHGARSLEQLLLRVCHCSVSSASRDGFPYSLLTEQWHTEDLRPTRKFGWLE